MRQTILTLLMLVVGNLCAQVQFSNPSGSLKVQLKKTDSKQELVLSNASGLELTHITLGLRSSTADYTSGLILTGTSDVAEVQTEYTALHGKRRQVSNVGNAQTLHFRNIAGAPLDVEICLYTDGLAFRYKIPSSQGTSATFLQETTAYTIPVFARRWMQRYVTHYEEDFPLQATPQAGQWGYPALFQCADTWMLVTEADVHRGYCATHLDNSADANTYLISYPDAGQGRGIGDVTPTAALPWASPWRIVIAGSLSTLVESTLVEDVSRPSVLKETDWIQPGRAAWVYWAFNHGTKDYPTCCRYVDLAVAMGWEYVLFDWEWDAMENGGRLEDAAAYARAKGIKPWIWYNSGGPHNYIGATPRDRMLTHENRQKEFAWLRSLGFVGVKIDFFESDKQHMMAYYLDILEDAAEARMMVNFHGATLPRGWSRTYPHLMSMEAVYGAEQYNNTPHMTEIAARLNCTLPFTRNVVGPMDYTPVTFTDSQHPHVTSNAHELALSVIFESGIQHLADRPEGFLSQAPAVQDFLRRVPASWDETRLLEGYPGEYIVLARRSGSTWYVAGLNGTNQPRSFDLNLNALIQQPAEAIVFTDDATPRSIQANRLTLASGAPLRVACLPQGGFCLRIE